MHLAGMGDTTSHKIRILLARKILARFGAIAFSVAVLIFEPLIFV